MAYDPDDPTANCGGQLLEAVTKDQLNTGLTGQIRCRVSERNLYACLFGVKRPISHVMGYFVSVLRERIANFEAPRTPPVEGEIIPSTAAMRPHIIGEALKEIAMDAEVSTALFDVLEVQNILQGQARITLVPPKNDLLNTLLASRTEPPKPK